MIIRILMGCIFFTFGLNGFLNFLPMPSMQGNAGAFIELLITSKLLYIIKVIEVGCSLLLLSGRYIALALLLLAPIIFNIVWFHIMLAPDGAIMGIVLLTMETFLLWVNRSSYALLLKNK